MTDFAEPNDLRAYLRAPTLIAEPTIGQDGYDESLVIGLALSSASSAIRRACNRLFEIADTASDRYFTAHRVADWRVEIPIDDTFAAVADVSIHFDWFGLGDYTTAFTGTFFMAPQNAPSKGRPYTSIILHFGQWLPQRQGAIKVSASWGWATVPLTIKNACLLQAARVFKRRDAPFGVAGSPEMGNELRLLPKLDPDVEVMCADYRRWQD